MNDLWFAIGLYFSHLLTDYYLQPTSWVVQKSEKKEKSWQVYAHASIAGFLASLFSYFLGVESFLSIFLLVAIPHLLIDLWKLYQPRTTFYYLVDQMMHILHLALIFLIFSNQVIFMSTFFNNLFLLKALIVIIGWLLLWQPAGITIGKLTKKYREEIDEADKDTSLPEAGKMIGLLERTLIFILILQGQLGAVGFLIAAKSILRYSDHKEVNNPIRLSEYVIIGTMMSFLVAILVGLACIYFIGMVEHFK